MFVTYQGKPYASMTSMAEQFHGVLKKSGVPDRIPYQMRHTFATNMIASEVMTVYEVAEYLGHNSIETTMRNYVKFANGIGKNSGWRELLNVNTVVNKMEKNA